MNTAHLRSILGIPVMLVLLQGGAHRCHGDNNHHADLAPGPGEESRAQKPPGFAVQGRAQLFEQIDKDHDHKLTFSEFSLLERLKSLEVEKQRKLFDFLDRNSDGCLEMHELHPMKPKWMIIARREFRRFDGNADAQLDGPEFSALMRSLGKDEGVQRHLFEQLDQNKNQKIDRHELGGKLPAFALGRIIFDFHDKDGSGGLDYSEYIMLPMVQRWSEMRRQKLFANIDADGDGEISKTEIGKMYQYRGQSRRFAPHGDRQWLRDQKAF